MSQRDASCPDDGRRSGRVLFAALTGVTLVVAACGGDDEDVMATVPPAALEGNTWSLTQSSPLGVSLGDVAVSARFDAGIITGTSGCNQYTTAYEVSGTSMTIGPDIASTRKACPPPADAVEAAYLERLPRTASYTIDGSTLTLADAGGETLLEYELTESAHELLGAWNVTLYYAGTAVVSVVGGVTLTAEFTADRVSGSTGCNTFDGGYTADGETISIGPLTSTRAACPSEELQRQESDYLAALQLATTFTVTGTRLDLFRPGGTYAVTLERS